MPVTPVGAEALSKMQALIRRDAQTLDDGRSKWRLQWYTEKLLNAAKRYQAERALHQDQIQFLFKVNNEAKVRQSTKSLVLEKAKVMLWEDIVAAREKRAGKRRGQSCRRHWKTWSEAEECHAARGRGSHRRQAKTWSEAQESRIGGRGSRQEGQTWSGASKPSSLSRGRSVRTRVDLSSSNE